MDLKSARMGDLLRIHVAKSTAMSHFLLMFRLLRIGDRTNHNTTALCLILLVWWRGWRSLGDRGGPGVVEEIGNLIEVSKDKR